MLHLTYKQNKYCIYIHQCGYPIESLASTPITEIRMYLFCMRTSVAGTITDTRFRIKFMCHGYEFPIYRLTHPFVQCIIPFFAWYHIYLYSISLPFVQGITSFYLAPHRGRARYCNAHVCLSVCLCVCLFVRVFAKFQCVISQPFLNRSL